MNNSHIERVIGLVFISISLYSISADNFVGSAANINTVNTQVWPVPLLMLGILTILLSLDEQVNKEWKKFEINIDSLISDIDQKYLGEYDTIKKTELQQRLEKKVTAGTSSKPYKEISDKINQQPTYERQFDEGHAASGGRIIDLEGHIPQKGENKGKLVHFGQKANSVYLWIVDEDGKFYVANRQTMHHEMPQMNQEKIDYHHRLHKLPHSTLAKGKKVLGSGTVLVMGGMVKEYDARSGHYVNLKDIPEFNKQGREVFEYFAKKSGWKEIKGGAKFKSQGIKSKSA